jgi:hypothetical protein
VYILRIHSYQASPHPGMSQDIPCLCSRSLPHYKAPRTKTFRECVKVVVALIIQLDLIDFSDRYLNWNYAIPCCSIDGTDCFIQEHYPFQRAYCSHKLNHSSLRYEIALALGCSRIVWVNGGVPAGANPDIVLTRSAFVHNLLPGEKAAADKGYQDNNTFLLTLLNADQRPCHTRKFQIQ